MKSSKIASVTIAKPVLTYNIHLYSPSFVTKSTNISYMNYLLVMYYKLKKYILATTFELMTKI